MATARSEECGPRPPQPYRAQTGACRCLPPSAPLHPIAALADRVPLCKAVSPAPAKKKFRGILPRRWVGERAFSWLGQSRRLAKEYERLCETSEAMIYATMSLIMHDFFGGVLDIAAVDTRAVVLVEGISDQIAIETLATRLGRNLTSEGVSVVSMGGAHALGRFLTRFGPHGANLGIAGLYDVGEESVVNRALQRAGFGSSLTRTDMEELGFYVCVVDLEDELIRALGAVSVEAVIDVQGELDSFRTLQKQPAWRGQRLEDQLRRFMGSGATRKIRYARLLVDALAPAQVPRPLHLVLAHVLRFSRPCPGD